MIDIKWQLYVAGNIMWSLLGLSKKEKRSLIKISQRQLNSEEKTAEKILFTNQRSLLAVSYAVLVSSISCKQLDFNPSDPLKFEEKYGSAVLLAIFSCFWMSMPTLCLHKSLSISYTIKSTISDLYQYLHWCYVC